MHDATTIDSQELRRPSWQPLAGLALLLLAAGSAGYVTRRLQSRGGDGGEPPAAA